MVSVFVLTVAAFVIIFIDVGEYREVRRRNRLTADTYRDIVTGIRLSSIRVTITSHVSQVDDLLFYSPGGGV